MSRSRLRAIRTGARAALGADVWVPPRQMAVEDAEITTIVDVTAQCDDKIAALSAHASQSDAAAVRRLLVAARDEEHLERVEEYVRADAPWRGAGVERGFGGVAPTAGSAWWR